MLGQDGHAARENVVNEPLKRWGLRRHRAHNASATFNAIGTTARTNARAAATMGLRSPVCWAERKPSGSLLTGKHEPRCNADAGGQTTNANKRATVNPQHWDKATLAASMTASPRGRNISSQPSLSV